MIAGRDYLGAATYLVEAETAAGGGDVFLWLGGADGASPTRAVVRVQDIVYSV